MTIIAYLKILVPTRIKNHTGLQLVNRSTSEDMLVPISFRLRGTAIILLVWMYVNCAIAADSKSRPISVRVRKQNIKIDDNSQIWIYDGALSRKQVTGLSELASLLTTDYQFVHRDLNYALKNGLTPFIGVFNQTDIENSNTYRIIKMTAKNSFGAEVELKTGYVELLHSLDPKPPVKEFCQKDIYYVTVFLTNEWGHNMYGQLSFYTISGNKNVSATEREEIVHTVHPKPGRMVLWPSCVIQSSHPPSVNYFANLLMLRLVLKAKADKQGIKYEGLPRKLAKEPSFAGWTFTNEDANREIDYAKHLKRKFFDSKKRGIYVFDDLFTHEELKRFRKILLDTGDTRTSVFDGSALEDNDNVQWIATYKVEEFITTPIWTRMKELLAYLTDENEWYPYDVALNLIRPADHTRIHPDAETHQFEYTFLLYLNENTTRTDFGETVFFEQERRQLDGIHQFTNPGGEEYEPIAAVWPKYGRVVIFRNVIHHSARPFSTSHLSCRYTFACKVSQTKRLALIKQVYEKMEYINDGSKEFEKLNRDLATGSHDDPAKSHLATEQLQEKLNYIKEQVSLQLAEYRSSILENI